MGGHDLEHLACLADRDGIYAVVDDTLLAKVSVPSPERGLSTIVSPRPGCASIGLAGVF